MRCGHAILVMLVMAAVTSAPSRVTTGARGPAGARPEPANLSPGRAGGQNEFSIERWTNITKRVSSLTFREFYLSKRRPLRPFQVSVHFLNRPSL